MQSAPSLCLDAAQPDARVGLRGFGGVVRLVHRAVVGLSNLVGVYPPECFPTEVRACGVGFAVACSRLGFAVGVFLLPSDMQVFGLQLTMMALAAVLVVGMAVSIVWAPEMQHLRLDNCANA